MRWVHRDGGDGKGAAGEAGTPAQAGSEPAPAAPGLAAPDQASAEGPERSEGSGGGPIGPEELERRRAALDEVIGLMRPAVQMDGGDLALVDVDLEAGVVEVRLEGACGSCAISSATLQGGVERLLRERLAWVTEVRGGVDDSLDPFESAALGRGAYVPRFE